MIEVSVRKDGVTISGHAGYAAFGYDIVCAGATALAQTLIKSVEDLTEDEIKEIDEMLDNIPMSQVFGGSKVEK